MHRLIYVSRSITRFPPDLKEILIQARRNNARLAITGALCFIDDVYCQYLEGDKIILENLYQVLLSDPRHKDVKLIELCSITERRFTNWAMGLLIWNKQTRVLFNVLNPGGAVDLYAITAESSAVTFDVLVNSSDWMGLELAAAL